MSLCVLYVDVYPFVMFVLFFFFKQKTAYEMRISDWSSDVCSSDLHGRRALKAEIRQLLSDQTDIDTEMYLLLDEQGNKLAGNLDLFDAARSEERRVGKGVSVRVDLGGRRIIKKKK